METQSATHVFERLNNWIKESVTVKLTSIVFLILIMLVPQSWIRSLILEREARAEAVVIEIASKWSGEQTLTGPVLVIPFFKHEKVDKGKDGVEIRTSIDQAFFLPEHLKITGKVDPQILYRGIFEAAVYESSLTMSADFLAPDFQTLGVVPEDIDWKDAHLILGIRDLRGISENPKLNMGDQRLSGEPSSSIGLTSEAPYTSTPESEYPDRARDPAGKSNENGIVARLLWRTAGDFRRSVTINLNLKGSTLLYFTPVGKITEVTLAGSWANPSFDGEFLPVSRSVTKAGFNAGWKVLHFNRPFSQQWTGTNQKISGSEFGVKLVIPVDQYQKSTRTAKYGVLVILLTFLSLFMVEIMKKVRIHPFQYILIGAALIIYYSLLLSFSEQLGYNLAYLVATTATVTMITLYSVTFLGDRKAIILFGSLLISFYGFIFIIIQQQDYSLLLGSLGLFLILGLIMYLSRNIKWYGQ